MLYNQPIIEHLQLALNAHLPCLCMIHRSSPLPDQYLYLQLSYSPMEIEEEHLRICFLLSYYSIQLDPEAQLQQHLQLTATLRNLRYLSIGCYHDVALHIQSLRQPQSPHQLDESRASWLLHLYFDPQQSSQLLHQSQRRLSISREVS
ncbi:hypothetical protein PVA45_08090 (plasmid) [Entomospira entomophila]|uniref:Uncharacterized protein n=1 Tax=Entomospira entomophila TaxID=2719988 RepID=A0A968GA96_9SPIO|nr:hypothetical protein [Entomospira entomophilus]NIZ41465.1 hypothetical protein [Entomospira entomophilus]WDI36299.1 hypothetical protein PVA45_08090 [Entomospira entomophilus]